MKPLRLAFLGTLVSCGVLALSACDNVGRAFDLNRGDTKETTTNIQAVPAGGVVVDGRPKVQNVFPKGNGWPGTVPIVVVFNESVNEASVSPSGGTPSLFVRLKSSVGTGTGTGTGAGSPPLPGSYDFLLGGRVVVIRPLQPFDTTQIQEYEVVATSELRDTDGVRYTTASEKVLGSFTPDQASTIEDGQVLTVLPVDNNREAFREDSVYVVFTKPATESTLKTGAGGSFTVRPAGGTALDGSLAFPVRIGGLGGGGGTADTRVVEFKPKSGTRLAAATDHEIVLDATIEFGTNGGKLDFRNRTPFARFSTVAPPSASSVTVGNPSTGAPDKVNSNNVAALLLDVAVPADAAAGDRVDARIYGLHKDGGQTGSLDFVDASAVLAGPGAQTASVDFTGKLGALGALRFREGPLLFAARLVRGSRTTGFVRSATTNNPALDVTPPTLTLPAADGNGNRVIYTDQERLVFWGQGAEVLGGATLTLASTPGPAPDPTTGTVFGFGAAGKFMFDPILLGRRTAPLGFTLTITDSSGNESMPITGSIVQRGVVTGDVTSGTLTVEAYDDATFAAVAGATVAIEPGLPSKPAVGRLTAVTGADGRAVFTGLGSSSYTVTVVSDAHHVITLLATPAGFVSLPLRPRASAVASLVGAAVFTSAPPTGTRILVGCNILDDVRNEEVLTGASTPTVVPSSQVRPNRPYMLTGLGGPIEPTAKPTFTHFACSVCGVTGLTKEAAQPPIAPAGNATVQLAMLPAAFPIARDLAATYDKDLGTWGGLDAANLAGTPTVRVMASVYGLPGMTAVGTGFAKVMSGTIYTIDASYLMALATTTPANGPLVSLQPKFWVSTEATDSTGNVARHRRIIDKPVLGTTFASAAVPGVSTLTPPGGPSTGSPSVTYEDRMDPTTIPSGFAFQVITATDSGGRQWRVLRQDTDAATGPVTVQLPDFVGLGATGLGVGVWSVFCENHLLFSSTFGVGDYVLEEMRREEVTYTRSVALNFTVN